MQRIQTLASDQPGDLQNLLSERLQQTQPLVNLLVVDLEPVDIPLCQSLRRRYPHLPILALGPPVSRDQLLQFQQLGLAAYVERYTPAATLWQWMQAILGAIPPGCNRPSSPPAGVPSCIPRVWRKLRRPWRNASNGPNVPVPGWQPRSPGGASGNCTPPAG
ncbi:hypothetical protein [Thermostichus sp. MS-CIW-23]